MSKTQGILLVSFGTSYMENAEKTLFQIEREVAEAYPSLPVYHAWSSGMIRRKLKARDNISILSVSEALQKMHADGVRCIAVQPTFLLDGIEYELMLEDIENVGAQFEEIRIGDTLLATKDDQDQMLRILEEAYPVSEQEAAIFMGHGTEHASNRVYAALNERLAQLGITNRFIGTVEGTPDFAEVLSFATKREPSNIVLAPFLVVAGDHATNDMAGDEEDSWKCQLQEAGFSVSCAVQGLGELLAVRALVLSHLKQIL